jgi:hypothetical protein
LADRRPPGFNVDLGFYDSPEVLSIPRKHRAAAVGVWTLCGAYAANKLTDGLVSEEKLKELGCTPAIKTALMSTKPEPLWVSSDAYPGAIQFTRWTKWQRTCAEVKGYREAEAERKRKAREASRNATTSDEEEMSGRTSAGQSADVRPDDRNPRGRAPARQTKTETKTKTKDFGYLPESATQSTARDSIAATPAAELVRATIPREINSATQTALRIQAGILLKEHQPDIVEEALREWASKTGVGPGVLPSLAADVIKRRNGHARAAPKGQPHKLRSVAELAQRERAREQAALPQPDQPKGIA